MFTNRTDDVVDWPPVAACARLTNDPDFPFESAIWIAWRWEYGRGHTPTSSKRDSEIGLAAVDLRNLDFIEFVVAQDAGR